MFFFSIPFTKKVNVSQEVLGLLWSWDYSDVFHCSRPSTRMGPHFTEGVQNTAEEDAAAAAVLSKLDGISTMKEVQRSALRPFFQRTTFFPLLPTLWQEFC